MMDKFKNQEALQKAYESLEKEFTRRSQRLRELQGKVEQGTLIDLPCKVGDTVYFIDADEVNAWIDEYKVKWFYCSSRGVNRVYSVCGTLAKNFRPKDFGKTVFLTREEAEKALEGMK